MRQCPHDVECRLEDSGSTYPNAPINEMDRAPLVDSRVVEIRALRNTGPARKGSGEPLEGRKLFCR